MNAKPVSVIVVILTVMCAFLVGGCETDKQRGYVPASAKLTNDEYLARDQADMAPAPGNTAQDTTQELN